MLALAQSARTLRGYMVLGAITADAAAKQVFPNAPRSPNAGHNMATYNMILACVQAGRLVNADGTPIYIPGTADCAASGIGVANVALSDVTHGAMAVAPFTGPAAPFVEAGAVLVGLFQPLFNHHAQAVKKEQSVLCAAVPAANNYLAIIAQAVQAGHATPAQAIAALNSLYSDFNSQLAGIRHGADPTVSGECNAACVMSTALHAVILQQISVYQDMAAQPAVTSSGPASAPAVSSGSVMMLPTSTTPAAAAAAAASSSSWLPIAAVALIGFFLLKVL